MRTMNWGRYIHGMAAIQVGRSTLCILHRGGVETTTTQRYAVTVTPTNRQKPVVAVGRQMPAIRSGGFVARLSASKLGQTHSSADSTSSHPSRGLSPTIPGRQEFGEILRCVVSDSHMLRRLMLHNIGVTFTSVGSARHTKPLSRHQRKGHTHSYPAAQTPPVEAEPPVPAFPFSSAA